MGKAQRIRAETARQKITSQRAAARRVERRRKLLIAGGSVAVVLVLVIAIVARKLAQSPERGAAPAVAAPAVAGEISSLLLATFNSVGAGTATGLKSISGQPELTAAGKPELLYMGGEYCPFRAGAWAIAAAVSRFGTLSGLHFIRSSHKTSTRARRRCRSSIPVTPVSTWLCPVEWYGEA